MINCQKQHINNEGGNTIFGLKYIVEDAYHFRTSEEQCVNVLSGNTTIAYWQDYDREVLCEFLGIWHTHHITYIAQLLFAICHLPFLHFPSLITS